MSDSLVLEHLRAMRAWMGRTTADLADIKQRLIPLELGQSATLREMSRLAETDAHLSARIERLGDRLERIERRLARVP
jgi:hypothetical protein